MATLHPQSSRSCVLSWPGGGRQLIAQSKPNWVLIVASGLDRNSRIGVGITPYPTQVGWPNPIRLESNWVNWAFSTLIWYSDILIFILRRVHASLKPGLSVRPSVRRSVGGLVFEQMNAQVGILGSLDASLHLYKTVCRSVSPSILSSHFSKYQWKAAVFIKSRSQEESHIIIPSFN